MDFFNIGTPELLVIALVGLLLFGPEDLLKAARTANGYLRSAQRMWREVASQLSTDLSIPPAAPEPDRSAMSPTPPSESTPPPDEPAYEETGYGP